MGRVNTRSVPDDHVAFVDLPEQDGSEVDGPDPVVGFFQADVMLFERTSDEEQRVFEPEGADVGDALHDEVPRVLERGQPLGIVAWGSAVAGAGGAGIEVLARPLVIVEGPKRLKARCWADNLARGGRQAPALSVRCMRSWAPFSCGDAG